MLSEIVQTVHKQASAKGPAFQDATQLQGSNSMSSVDRSKTGTEPGQILIWVTWLCCPQKLARHGAKTAATTQAMLKKLISDAEHSHVNHINNSMIRFFPQQFVLTCTTSCNVESAS